jgi:hypothetical protein
MTEFAPFNGAIGGALIGLAAVILMLGIGRIAGISGIARLAMTGPDRRWRIAFLIGLPLGGLIAAALGLRDWRAMSFPAAPLTMIIAGLLVGAGATLGAGCTSGHGICGIARLSPRSIAATLTFMAVAVITVFILRHVV